MLTSRERLNRCFRHMETDRPGLFIRGVDNFYPVHESYKPLRELVLAKCDLKSNFPTKEYKESSTAEYAVELYNEDFERHIEIIHTPKGDLKKTYLEGLKGNPGHTEKYLIETPEEAEMYMSLPEKLIKFNPEIFFNMDREIGDRGIVVTDIGCNPAGLIADLVGSENFAIWSIEHRELLHRLMKREMDIHLKNIIILLDNKIGPYFAMSGEEYITPPLHGPKDFYDFNVKYDKPIVDMIHNAGGLMHIHSHGSLKGLLEYFVEIGTDVLHPIEAPPMGNVTAREAKNILRDKVCIEGNIQIGDMYKCTADEIKEMTAELIREAFDDSKGLIVCPTASPYINVIDEQGLENYAALISTVYSNKKIR